MKKPILILLTLLWSASVFAQVDLSLPNLVVQPDESFTVPVMVNEFQNVGSAQFSIQWDPAVIQFVELKDFALPVSSILPNFDTSAVATNTGRLTMVWIEDNANEVSLDPNTALFNISFRTIGNLGTSTTLDFTDTPTSALEFARSSGERFEPELTSGFIQVGTVSTNDLLARLGIEIDGPTPNPSFGTVSVLMNTERSVQAHCSLHSVDGISIKEWIEKVPVGKSIIDLEPILFRSSGMYFLTVEVDQNKVSLPILRK